MNEQELREQYRQRTSRRANDRSQCASAEDLVSLARGAHVESQPAARDGLIDHLVECASCSGELKMIRSLESWASGAAEHLDGEDMADVEDELVPQPESSRRRPPWVYSLVAALAMVSIGLGLWAGSLSQEVQRLRSSAVDESPSDTAQLARARSELEQAAVALSELRAERDRDRERAETIERRVAELEQPQFNLNLFDVDPDSARERSAPSGSVELAVPREHRWFSLILHTNAAPNASPARIVILAPNESQVFTSDGLRQSEFGTFTLSLPAASFPSGEYRIELYDSSRDAAPQHRYTIRIVRR